MNIYIAVRDKRKSVLDARNDVLEPLRIEQPEGTAALKSFLPRWSLSAFYGRQEAERRLNTWLKSPSKPVMVVDGGPLVGKKRLAIEWADSLGPEWEVGWLRHDRDTEALQRIATYGRNTIIVVDGMSPHLSELLHDLSQHKAPPDIRVLLTVRNARALRFRDPYASALIQDVQALHLGPIGETADRERWFEELCRHYADRLGVPVPPQRPGFIQALGIVPVGVLHVAALAAARTGEVPSPSRSIEDVLFALWKTETDGWRNSHETPGPGNGVSDSQLERLEQAVMALSLLEPRDVESGAELLQRIPSLSGTDPGIRKDIAAWAGRMYPPTDATCLGIVEFSPRIVIAAACLHTPGNDAFLRALLSSLTESEALVVLGRLAEVASLLPSAAAWAAVVVDGDVEKLGAAIQMALAAPPGNFPLDQELGRCVISCSLNEDQAIALQEYIPEGFLPITNLALQELRVKHLRDHVTEHADKYETGLAAALTHLAALLYARGRSPDSLKAAEESAALYRRLAAENPVRYDPPLAASLNDLGSVLAQVGGRSDDALKATEESVSIWRRLAAADPALHEPDLGSTLTNLVGRIVEVGGATAGALKAAEEAVALYRGLAAEDPERYESNLAGTLNNQANILAERGGLGAEALKAAEESTAIRRRLATQDPRRYEPDLAGTLNNLGNRLADTPGRSADAPNVAEEAVVLYRRLAVENPGRYESKLAGALNTLSNRLAEAAGRRADALKSAEESVTIWRRLADQNPAPYEPDLSGTLNNLAILYEIGGRRPDALRAAEESVALYRRLAAQNPTRYEPALAGTLNTLANILSETAGPNLNALRAAEESVALYRRLAAENPTLYEPALAGTLTALGHRLSEGESWKAALLFWKESMQIYERLARQDPRYKEPLTHVQRMVWERTGLPN